MSTIPIDRELHSAVAGMEFAHATPDVQAAFLLAVLDSRHNDEANLVQRQCRLIAAEIPAAERCDLADLLQSLVNCLREAK